MSSIFVQIATYHDYELPNTIMDLMEKSSGNNIINFGVYLCYYEKQDIDLPNLKNAKYKIDMAPHGIGLGYSRLMAHNFYDGEDYYLQIDSHTKMNKNWDQQIIDDILFYKNLGFEKPLLTTYPRNYWYEEDKPFFDKGDHVTQISFDEKKDQFANIYIPSQTAVGNEENNIFSNSVSGGSIFTVKDFIVPNPRIAFYGEEIMIAARAFTNGFDLLLPRKQYMYHLYFNHSKPKESLRRLLWNDFPDQFAQIDTISKAEIVDIFSNNLIGKEQLGKERSLDEFGSLIGLDFKNKTVISNKCI